RAGWRSYHADFKRRVLGFLLVLARRQPGERGDLPPHLGGELGLALQAVLRGVDRRAVGDGGPAGVDRQARRRAHGAGAPDADRPDGEAGPQGDQEAAALEREEDVRLRPRALGEDGDRGAAVELGGRLGEGLARRAPVLAVDGDEAGGGQSPAEDGYLEE